MRRALAVEIVGPAGAGKTSLMQSLRAMNAGIEDGVHLRKISYAPTLFTKTLLFLPSWLRHYRRSRWFTWSDMRSIVYLEAWLGALKAKRASGTLAIVFDHGPVFRLAFLREFGPPVVRGAAFRNWSKGVQSRWMDALDTIVWLDAPDSVLLERLERRGHWYVSGGASRQDSLEFLARYRGAYAEILEKERPAPAPRLLRFRSDERSANQIAEAVMAELVSWAGPRGR